MITALGRRQGITEEEMWRKLKATNSLNRIVEPEEIARAVVFLASDDASGMTGHNMIVSCGFSPNSSARDSQAVTEGGL